MREKRGISEKKDREKRVEKKRDRSDRGKEKRGRSENRRRVFSLKSLKEV